MLLVSDILFATYPKPGDPICSCSNLCVPSDKEVPGVNRNGKHAKLKLKTVEHAWAYHLRAEKKSPLHFKAKDEIFQSTTITKNSFTTARNVVIIQPINVYCVRRQNILVQIFKLPPEYSYWPEQEVQQ